MKRKIRIELWRYWAIFLFLLSVTLFLHGCAGQKETIPLYPVNQKEQIRKSTTAGTSLLASAKQALREDEFNQAEIFLERALRLEPRNGELWHTMGQIKFDKNHHAQAVQFCLKSNSLAGKNPQLMRKNWKLMEKAYFAMDETEKAAQVRKKYMDSP